MNSFKKIAFVIAAALTSTMVLAPSSNAAPLAVTVASVANTTTAAAPHSVAVPSTNVIDAGHSVAIAATADTGTSVSFSASSTVKLVTALNTVDSPKNVLSGSSSLSAVSTGSAMTVYAYTTSSATGSVTIVNGAYSTIIYIKGTAGHAAKVIATVPGSVAVNTAPTISVSAVDVFGNAVACETIAVTLIGANFFDGTITKSLTTASVTSIPGVLPVTVLGSASATLSAVSSGNVTVIATDVTMADTALGLPAAVKTAFITFPVTDLDAQISALKAELAAERAGRAADKVAADKLALDAKTASDKAFADAKIVSDKALADAKVASDKALADAKTASDLAAANAKANADIAIAKYKAIYNALATKWNKKHPTAKVALLK
jgi:hypothetical protein